MSTKIRALGIFLGTLILSLVASELILRWRIEGGCGAGLLACLSCWSWLEESSQRVVVNINAAGAVLGIIFVSLSKSRQTIKVPDIHGSARWATHQEISEAGLLSGGGAFVGQLPDGRYLRHDGPEHYSVIAPTRSGKGAGVVVPTLLTWPESTIVYDVKEENWRITAGYRATLGRVIRFSPISENSDRYNPLQEVRLGIHEVRDVQNIANMIVDPDGNGYSDHWVRTGYSLLVATILHILYLGDESEKNLAGVTNFLSQADLTLTETLHVLKKSCHIRGADGEPVGPHPVVAASAQDMLNKSENERTGVLSTTLGFLTLYRDPIVAVNTEASDFKVMDLVQSERPVSLYIVVPPSDIDRLRPLVRLIVNQFCGRLTEELNPAHRTQRLLLMLDEFPTLGRLEFFESALGFLAGYGIKAMLISQALNQLRKTYGQNSSILDNCHVRIFYASTTIETAEYVSRSLGSSTVRYQSEGESRSAGSFVRTSLSLNQQIAGRPLLTPREVMELPENESLIFVGNHRPIRSRKVKYYTDQNFLSRLIDAPIAEPRVNLKGDISFWREKIIQAIKIREDRLNAQNNDTIVISPVEETAQEELIDEIA